MAAPASVDDLGRPVEDAGPCLANIHAVVVDLALPFGSGSSLGGLGVLPLFRTAMQLLSTLKDEKIDHLGDVLRGALCGMGA
jgi:hypothetical protein